MRNARSTLSIAGARWSPTVAMLAHRSVPRNTVPLTYASLVSTIEVRRVTRRDLVQLIAALPSRPPEEHRRRLGAQDRGGFVYLIAWIGDVPVGFVGVGLQAGWSDAVLSESRGYAKVRDLWVDEPIRRRGVGRTLML